MAGNIWRAFNRNPDLGRNLGELLGQLKQNSDRESQYAALDELLNPKDTVPVMGDPATIALRGGGTAELPRFQGTETITRPRTMLDLSGPETMRLASILKMNPVNAVDLLTKTAEANQPKRQIIQNPYLGVGEVTTPRTGGSTYRNLQPGVPRTTTTKQPPAAKNVTRTLVGSDGKPHDILFMFDNLGNELNRKDLGVSYQKPAKGGGGKEGKGGSGGQSDTDTRFFLGRIKDVTEKNAQLGQEATNLMAGYQKSDDGTVSYVNKEGETVPVKGDAAKQLWNELQTKLKGIYRQIDQNDQILLHDNQKVGGTWKIPDRKKERTIGQSEPSAPQPQVSDEDTQALDWAKRNPNDPRAAKILKLLGGK